MAGPNKTQNAGGLSSLIAGLPLPKLPDNMRELHPALQLFIRQVLEYLRRLAGFFTGVNILNTITNELNITTGILVANRYHAATHKFQSRTVQLDGTVGPWVDWEGDQPVKVDKIVENVTTVGANLAEAQRSDVYVLQMGSEATVDIGCACNFPLIACWYEFTSTLTDAVWSDPTVTRKWCGTPPGGVPINQWISDGTTAILYKMGTACVGGTCPDPPPPEPPNPPDVTDNADCTDCSGCPDTISGSFSGFTYIGFTHLNGQEVTLEKREYISAPSGLLNSCHYIETSPDAEDGISITCASNNSWVLAMQGRLVGWWIETDPIGDECPTGSVAIRVYDADPAFGGVLTDTGTFTIA